MNRGLYLGARWPDKTSGDVTSAGKKHPETYVTSEDILSSRRYNIRGTKRIWMILFLEMLLFIQRTGCKLKIEVYKIVHCKKLRNRKSPFNYFVTVQHFFSTFSLIKPSIIFFLCFKEHFIFSLYSIWV